MAMFPTRDKDFRQGFRVMDKLIVAHKGKGVAQNITAPGLPHLHWKYCGTLAADSACIIFR